ncbi:Polyketide cyclase SnoaL-like domain-containing protein, partial [Cynara cardunculus var. scolymus]
MILKSFPSTTTPLNSTSINPLFFDTTIFHDNVSYVNSSKPITEFGFGFQKTHHLKRTSSQLPLALRGSNGGANKAMETVLKLYEAIKSKDVNEMSEIIGHDCLCICNFVSTFRTFRGKKQVMEFFSSLRGNLGNNFEFVVQPTLHDGMTVGVSWKLECSKTHKPLGKGFSFHMCHMYQGKVLIRNVEMFVEPLLHIEPFGLKIAAFVASLTGQLVSQAILKGDKKKAAYYFFSLVALAILFIV